MPFVGETLPLSLQLFDFNPGKFTRANLSNQDGVDIAGTPFDLVHIGLGKYTSDAVVMPSGVVSIEATYEVFATAANRTAGTPLDSSYTAAKDVFRLEVPDSVLLDLLTSIFDIVTAILGQIIGDLLIGVVPQDELIGVVASDPQVGIIEDADQIGKVEDDQATGNVEDAGVVGKIDCD